MTEIVATVRLILAIVFVVSAVAKLRDRDGSREAVRGFGVPTALVGVVAGGLPFAELTCAVLLILPDPAATVGAVASLLLLGVFTLAVVVNLLRGNRVDCHCFGSVGDQGEIGWHTVARNVAFMLLAAISLIETGSLVSVPGVLIDMTLFQALLWFAGLLAIATIVVMGMALQQLIARYGAVLLKIEALEQATGLAEPQLAPAFTLPDLDGVEVSLVDELAAGRPALVTFVSPNCSNCMALLPDLLEWQSDAEHPVSLLTLSDGSVEDNREKIQDVEGLRVLLQPDRTISDELGLLGTPAAVLVGVDGRVAGAAAHGADAIRQLHTSVLQTMRGDNRDHQHVHQIEERPVSVGDPAPEVELRSESDEVVTVHEAFGDDAVAVFWRFDCGFCAQIVDDLRALETTTEIRIVTGSTVEAIRDSGLTSPIVRDLGNALESWLRVPGTPSAARIRDGALDSNVAVGGPDVLDLLRASQRDEALVD